MIHTDDTATVWLQDGLPQRLVWRGARYRAVRRATPILESAWTEELTHPIERRVGWRVTAADEEGGFRVFEIRRYAGQKTFRVAAVSDERGAALPGGARVLLLA